MDEDDTVEGVNASLLVKKAHSYQDLLVVDREEQVLVPATSNSTEDLRIAGSFNSDVARRVVTGVSLVFRI